MSKASGKELKLSFLRFLDMVHRERAYQRVTLEALNFSGEVGFGAGLSFQVRHEGRDACFWKESHSEASAGRLCLQAKTLSSGQEVFAGAQVDLPEDAIPEHEDKTLWLRCRLPLRQGEAQQIDKRIVIFFAGSADQAL